MQIHIFLLVALELILKKKTITEARSSLPTLLLNEVAHTHNPCIFFIAYDVAFYTWLGNDHSRLDICAFNAPWD